MHHSHRNNRTHNIGYYDNLTNRPRTTTGLLSPVCKITQRNNIRRANTCDPAHKLLNEEITSDIQKHKQNMWKEHLDAHWDHRHYTHTLWKTIHGLSNRAPPHTLNTSITFNNKIATTPKHIANCFTKQFINTVKHTIHKTNRHINRATHNIQGYNITLTTSQVQEAIKQSKNNNSQGPDKLNIRHLKHIGPLPYITANIQTDPCNTSTKQNTLLIRKLLQTNFPGTIIKFIANYIKGHKANTTYINHTSKQRQLKTGVPQGDVLSPTLFNIYTSDLPPPSAPVQVMAYADDITITSTHTSTSAAKKYIQPCQHKVFAGTKQNNLLLNPDKTTCTLFTPDAAEYTSNLDLTINNKALPMETHPKVQGLTLDPELTYSTHIHNISVQAHKSLQIINAFTSTGWG